MMFASINIPIAGLSGVLIYVFQVTNQLKKYSFYTVFDKIVVLLVISLVLVLGIDNFIFVVIADTFSKIVVLGLMVYSCRDIIFGNGCDFATAYKETQKNISVGLKLMFANLAGMLVLGFGRFLIERFDNVEVYGAYSFSISTMNLILVFVSAIGLVIYPTLGRLDTKNYSKYFIQLNNIICLFVYFLLVAYFPLSVFVLKVMSKYVVVLEYLPIIFSIIFIQAKMQILINPITN